MSAAQIALPVEWPERVTRDWAWGGATGKGVSVCILDSGVEGAHPLVGGLAGAVTVSVDSGREPGRRGGHRGRPLRPRHGVRRHRPLDRARVRPLQRARARRRLHRIGPGAPCRSPVGGRAGLRPDQHEPVDDEAPVRGAAPRSGGLGVLPAHDARRGRAQHAGRELPVEVLLRDLGRQPRGGRPDDVLLQPEPAGRVLRAWRRRRRRVARRVEDQGIRATASRRRT